MNVIKHTHTPSVVYLMLSFCSLIVCLVCIWGVVILYKTNNDFFFPPYTSCLKVSAPPSSVTVMGVMNDLFHTDGME